MTDTTESLSSSSLTKRSWRRFSLRALFFAVLAVASGLGWIAYRARSFQTQYEWIQEIQARHPNALTLKPLSNEWFWRPLIGDAAVTVKRAVLNGYDHEQRSFDLTADDVEQVMRLTEAEQLLLAGPAITDESVRFVRDFRQLTLLGLENTAITDAGTASLVHLHRLTGLAIITNPNQAPVPTITEASLKNLVVGKDLHELGLTAPITNDGLSLIVENCPNLMVLELFGSRISGEGLARLRALTKLSHLRISDNRSIDDSAALQLVASPTLTFLWLEETSVSQRGASELKAKLPRAWVNVEKRYGVRGNRRG